MRRNAAPYYISDSGGGAGPSLQAEVINLSGHADERSFSEDRLQQLIFDNPGLLPVSSFEPYFSDIIPVCRELPTPAGPLDNLYVTPQGNLILVECKLWRNPESRRKVIAQIMDYAKEIAEWGYDDLMKAVNRANNTNQENPLYTLVEKHPEAPDESVFVDQVSRNLRLGRHLLLIVGDGIQEGAERLADFLQKNMGLHFTLGLLEIGIYRFPGQKGHIVIPNVLAKTTIIERGVIRIEGERASVVNVDEREKSSSAVRSENLSEIEFFEALARHDKKSAEWLGDMLKRMEELGVTWEVQKSLLPRYSPDGERVFNFGYFKTNGKFITSNAMWGLDKMGLEHLGIEYIDSIAALIPGSVVKTYDKGASRRIYTDDKTLTISDLRGKEARFMEAVAAFIEKIKAHTQ